MSSFQPFAAPGNPTINPTRNPTARTRSLQSRAYRADLARTAGETSPEWEFVKANKWYLLGGGLLLAAGVSYLMKK